MRWMPADEVTAGEGPELAGVEGATPLDATTETFSRLPRSGTPSLYVVPEAPEIATQLAPLESHRCHW